jgi:hypothetical protein
LYALRLAEFDEEAEIEKLPETGQSLSLVPLSLQFPGSADVLSKGALSPTM